MNKISSIVKVSFSSLLLTIFLIAVGQAAWAASTKDEIKAMQDELQAVKDGQQAIRKDLAEIKRLLQARPTAQAAAPTGFQPSDISIEDAPVLGKADAVITLVEYSDYQCPYCRRHYTAVMPEIVKKYVDSGQVRYVMREFPLTSLHPRAMDASHAALCALEQGKYWEMHNLLFDNQKAMALDDFRAHSQTLGLDADSFNSCLVDKKYQDVITVSLNEGGKLGVSGTPSFVIGLSDSEDPSKATVTKFIRGAQGVDAFTRAIEELLADANGEAADNEGP